MVALRAGHSGTHFVRGRVDSRDIMRLEGLGELKTPVTSDIKPPTFWLLA
jgi:hypothetical protein